MVLMVGALGAYLAKFHLDYFENPRVMGWFVLMIFAMTVAIRLAMPESRALAYLLPTSTVAMLLGVLLGIDVAILTTVILAMIVGYVTNSMELIMYTLVGGILAPLTLRRIERLGIFVWTGLLVGMANMVVILTFALPQGTANGVDIIVLAGIALVNGAASASLALGGFYVLSNALGITTFIQLMDLSRPTHPLFRELLTKAPGTYHHSIIVGNLAEAAADAINADPLLARVAAYYHDVGKIKNPHYFVENQSGQNPHDTLKDPYKSAEIIINHVKDGVTLAKKHKVPTRIRDFIQQHHGTTHVAFFHAKAQALDGSVLVEEGKFRYPGPKPQRRESAILMLADSIEAFARVQKPTTVEEIHAIVRQITDEKMQDGQLDECDLNLKDITIIQQAFIQVLQGVYHTRIAYPDKDKPKVTISSTATVVNDGATRPAALPPVDKKHDAEPYRNPG
jgi:cyclic-di-AMP phosphodiesterase PgpH